MSDFKQAPEPGDETIVLDRAPEEATPANIKSVTATTPTTITSLLAETGFLCPNGISNPARQEKWNKAMKNAKGSSRLPTKDEFEALAKWVAIARERGVSEKEIGKFLLSKGYNMNQYYWSGTSVTGHGDLYAYCWLAGNTNQPSIHYDTPLKHELKTTAHYAQYIKPIGA